jgi:hypothetical protein
VKSSRDVNGIEVLTFQKDESDLWVKRRAIRGQREQESARLTFEYKKSSASCEQCAT